MSSLLLNGTGNKEEIVCERCSVSEIQLKEVLNELSSAQVIIDILQKELLLFKTITTLCTEDQISTKEPSNKPTTDVWNSPAPMNITSTSQNCVLPTWAVSTNSISIVNRYVLPNLKGATTNHYEAQKVFTQKPHQTRNPQVKGNKIITILNGVPDSYRKSPSITYNNEVNPKVKSYQTRKVNTRSVESPNKGKKKVIIIADSHIRNCATRLQENLNSKYIVFGFVKPGAQMKEISKSVNEELRSLKCDDFVVVWGGANDISKNNTKEALKLSEFMTEHNELNVVLINSPHRHDLLPDSCVNHEVKKFNRQLNKIVKLQSKAKVLEVDLDRNHFTRNGLHLNSEGKKLVSHKLALAVPNFPTKHHSATIPATWKDPPHIDTNPTTQILSTEEGNNSSANSSQHRRRYPAQRNQDFLWF